MDPKPETVPVLPRSGVLPAAVTPFRPSGEPDLESLAKLLAYFKVARCTGVVLAGTNGEGPSLSTIEKRDLVRAAVHLADPLPIILGIATPSLEEAAWLASQAGKAGAAAVLLMPPGYYRPAHSEAIAQWIEAVADRATCPVLAYNFPKYTGVTLGTDLVARFAEHPNVAGFKDSSGDPANLPAYRQAAPGKLLFVGDETLLPQALVHGWDGTISGAANILPQWLSRYISLANQDPVKASTLWDILAPAIHAVRSHPQPAANKAVLHHWQILANPSPRLPLQPTDPLPLAECIRHLLGLSPDNLGLP